MKQRDFIRRFLIDRDIKAIEKLASSNTNIFRTLSSMLYDDDPLVRWRAIEGLGAASKIIANRDIEKVRRQIRRILWLMNDESGGLCWNGPEAIGEIIHNVPELFDEYGIVLTSFLGEEPFETGTRWAIARIGQISPGIFNDSIEILINSLASADPRMRGYSIKALTALEDTTARETIKTLTEDTAVLEHYDFSAGKFEKIAVNQLAELYLKSVKLPANQL